tara:strand:+ start:340 stop:546 length:207 start_codon:yes stop_codon:yes gene_type:complete
MVDVNSIQMAEIIQERTEECIKNPKLIADLILDIEELKKESARKDYQIQELQKSLKSLNDRLINESNS